MNSPTATASLRRPTSLLDIPAELRLHIYSYIIPDTPFVFDPKDYGGLLWSCKVTREEFESELCKAITQHIHEVASSIRERRVEIVYTPPTTFHGWRNLTVSRPKTDSMFLADDPFLDLTTCRFDKFTVTFHRAVVDMCNEVPSTTYEEAPCRPEIEMTTMYHLSHHPGTKDWRFVWCHDVDCRSCAGKGTTWEWAERSVPNEVFTVVEFHRKSLE